MMTHSPMVKVFSALFYALSSLLIVVVNKVVLTSFSFPSFEVLGIGQMVASIVLLWSAKQLNIIAFPDLDNQTLKQIFPLPLLYFFNLVFGLGSTKTLSLPMFTVLRRFSIVFTMMLEYFFLGKNARVSIQVSVYMMVLGAIVAASNDLAFDATGYIMIMLNNTMTALNGVFVKKILQQNDLGKYGIMFYNSFFMVVPALVYSALAGNFHVVMIFDKWTNLVFILMFILSCIMGFILNFATVLCTHTNSALTTTVVGCLKNILVMYVGMIVGGDYKFSWINFAGLNISIIGSLVYSYLAFTEKAEPVSKTEKALPV